MPTSIWAEANIPTKLLNNHFANAKAEAEPTLILVFGWGQLPEALKEFVDILLLYTAPCIHYFCQEETVLKGTGLF